MRRIGVGRWMGLVLAAALVATTLTGCGPPIYHAYVQRTADGLELVTCEKEPIGKVALIVGHIAWEYSGPPADRVPLPAFSEGQRDIQWRQSEGGGGELSFDSTEVTGDMIAAGDEVASKQTLFRDDGLLRECENTS